MTAERALYLRMPVSAFTAESRALNSAGGRHIRRICHEKETVHRQCAAQGEPEKGLRSRRPCGRLFLAGMPGDGSGSDGRKDGEG
ncbi:UNVERIFIED_ORG: hypothetical protein B5F06_02575 [Lacrimispora saccharolytica]